MTCVIRKKRKIYIWLLFEKWLHSSFGKKQYNISWWNLQQQKYKLFKNVYFDHFFQSYNSCFLAIVFIFFLLCPRLWQIISSKLLDDLNYNYFYFRLIPTTIRWCRNGNFFFFLFKIFLIKIKCWRINTFALMNQNSKLF